MWFRENTTEPNPRYLAVPKLEHFFFDSPSGSSTPLVTVRFFISFRNQENIIDNITDQHPLGFFDISYVAIEDLHSPPFAIFAVKSAFKAARNTDRCKAYMEKKIKVQFTKPKLGYWPKSGAPKEKPTKVENIQRLGLNKDILGASASLFLKYENNWTNEKPKDPVYLL